jgi:hypothetical protein
MQSAEYAKMQNPAAREENMFFVRKALRYAEKAILL